MYCPSRALPAVGHEIHLQKPGRKVVPLAEGANGHRVLEARPRLGRTPSPSASVAVDGEQPINRGRNHLQ